MSAEPDYLPADALAEDEPKYLRRQKPVEIRRRKFSRKAWPLYRRAIVGGGVVLLAVAAAYGASSYLLRSPGVLLESQEQIEVQGNRFVSQTRVVEKFAADMGRSVLRVPLADRRKEVESIAWVEQATVQRVLPNRIRVDITERTPVAFLRGGGGDLSLVDAHGVILDRPPEGEFRFPVVSGIAESMAADVRAQRMNLFVEFMKDIEATRPGADDHISEADLSDASDVRATVTGLGSAVGGAPAVLVHFGDSDFGSRFRLLADNINQWQSNAGAIESVDLRFARQVVVNPETRAVPASARRLAAVHTKTARKLR